MIGADEGQGMLSLSLSLSLSHIHALTNTHTQDATKWLPKWLGCEPRLIVVSLDSQNYLPHEAGQRGRRRRGVAGHAAL